MAIGTLFRLVFFILVSKGHILGYKDTRLYLYTSEKLKIIWKTQKLSILHKRERSSSKINEVLGCVPVWLPRM